MRLHDASPVLILPPSQALAERVLFFVVRNPRDARGTFDIASAPTWQSRFPANLYSTLTFVHGGALHDADSGAVLPSITASGLMTRAVLRRYVDSPETTVVVFRPGALTDLRRTGPAPTACASKRPAIRAASISCTWPRPRRGRPIQGNGNATTANALGVVELHP